MALFENAFWITGQKIMKFKERGTNFVAHLSEQILDHQVKNTTLAQKCECICFKEVEAH